MFRIRRRKRAVKDSNGVEIILVNAVARRGQGKINNNNNTYQLRVAGVDLVYYSTS